MRPRQNATRHTEVGFVELSCVNVHGSVGTASSGAAAVTEGSKGPDEAARVVRLRFAVRDTGCGIAPDIQSTLFDRYRSIGGVGLGLYLSKRQVDLMGGRMEVQSPWQPNAQPGAQFAFTLQLPLVADPYSPAVAVDLEQRTEDARDAPPHLPAELNVLIADDSRTNRKILRTAFARHCSGDRWTITETASAEDAVRMCEMEHVQAHRATAKKVPQWNCALIPFTRHTHYSTASAFFCRKAGVLLGCICACAHI